MHFYSLVTKRNRTFADDLIKILSCYGKNHIPRRICCEYEQGVTGLQIAESISPALARNVVSCGVNGETVELNRPINEDANVELYKFEDEQGKHTFWHTSAHLLAEALQELYPGIQFGFGLAVESGFFYDVMPAEGQVISENDFAKIEAKMMELAKKNEPVVRKEVAKADALAEFKADGQTYKCEHIEQDLEDGTITTYTQGNFTDLCRGPHLMNTGLIKAVKITSVAGAFWRGDAKREQMTRIYGISFPKKKMLDEYLVILEEAKKRDHRKIGKEMELFMFSERVGKGLPIWLPKGTQLRLRLPGVASFSPEALQLPGGYLPRYRWQESLCNIWSLCSLWQGCIPAYPDTGGG